MVDLIDAHLLQLLFTFSLKAAIQLQCHFFRWKICRYLQLPYLYFLTELRVGTKIISVILPRWWSRRLAGFPPHTFHWPLSRGPLCSILVDQLSQGLQQLPIGRCQTPRGFFTDSTTLALSSESTFLNSRMRRYCSRFNYWVVCQPLGFCKLIIFLVAGIWMGARLHVFSTSFFVFTTVGQVHPSASVRHFSHRLSAVVEATATTSQAHPCGGI